MIDFEKKLKCLPRASLSKRADRKLRYRLLVLRFAAIYSNKEPVRQPGIFAFKRAFAAIVLALFLISGTSVYAYSSGKVIRGSALYPIKRGLEKIELGLAAGPEKKIVVLNKLAQRRLAEAQLIGRSIAVSEQSIGTSSRESVENEDLSENDNLAETINDASEDMNEADDQSERLEAAQGTQAVLKNMAEADKRHVRMLEELAGSVGLDAHEKVVDRVAVTLDQARQRRKNILRKLDETDGKRQETGLPAAVDSTSSAPETVLDKVKAEKSLRKLKSRVDEMRADMTKKKAPPRALDKLIGNLNAKMDNTQKAISDGDFEKAGGLLEKTEALTNNGGLFLKVKPDQKQFPRFSEPADGARPEREDKDRSRDGEAEKNQIEEKSDREDIEKVNNDEIRSGDFQPLSPEDR